MGSCCSRDREHFFFGRGLNYQHLVPRSIKDCGAIRKMDIGFPRNCHEGPFNREVLGQVTVTCSPSLSLKVSVILIPSATNTMRRQGERGRGKEIEREREGERETRHETQRKRGVPCDAVFCCSTEWRLCKALRHQVFSKRALPL